MKDEIKERLEKGCRKLFYDEKHNEYNCGLFDLAICPKCIARLKQHEESFKAGTLKKKEEFCLSDKIEVNPFLGASLRVKDVKEFIERLKAQAYENHSCGHKECIYFNKMIKVIDKLAGDKLI